MVRFQKVQYILILRHEIELQVFTLLSQYRSAWYLYWFSIYVEFNKNKGNLSQTSDNTLEDLGRVIKTLIISVFTSQKR